MLRMDFLWPSWHVYAVISFVGAIIGSFLNSLVWRTARNIAVVTWERSQCVHCHRRLVWYENIPLFSFLFLQGKCRTCQRKIPVQYLVVEVVTGLVFCLVFARHQQAHIFGTVLFLRDIFFTTLLVFVFVYDALYMIIQSRVIWLGVVVGFVVNAFVLQHQFDSLVLGAVIGSGIFLLQFVVSQSRWIGSGDVLLGLMMGVWLGFPLILVALLLAYVMGAIVGLALVVGRDKSWQTKIPFGTFLAVGTFVTVLYGNSILTWYLHLFD